MPEGVTVVEIRPEKKPYVAWMSAVLALSGMSPSVFATRVRSYVITHPEQWGAVPDGELSKRALEQRRLWSERRSDDGSYRDQDAYTKNVRGWVDRGSVPEPAILRNAIIAVVHDVLPDPPESVVALGEWKTFRQVLELADTTAARNRDVRELAQQRGRADRNENARNVLRAAGRPGDIDPVKELALGSALFGDAMPPYVPRAADAIVAARLADPKNHAMTVIVGPPKSGKSRSVFALLAAMDPPPIIWWHNPSPGNLGPLLEHLKKVKPTDPDRPQVLVLDDVGDNGLDSQSGLTEPRLRSIARLVRSVVVIVHDDVFAAWHDHTRGGRTAAELETYIGIGATPALVELLETNRVDYSVILDTTELEAAVTALAETPPNDVEGLDLTRFAEAMATVGKLLASAGSALAGGGMRAALVDAAVDATVTDPAGAPLDWIETLTRIHFHRHNPNAPWRRTDFDDTLVTWATKGFSPGSPHAILTRAETVDGDRYRLLDALIPHLRTPDRTLDHLTEHTTPQQNYSVGLFFYELLRRSQATQWWTIAAAAGHSLAAFALGVLVDEGDSIAAHTDTPQTAIELWVFASHLGSPHAALSLGNVADRTGIPIADYTGIPRNSAEWWILAFQRGHPYAAHNLAIYVNRDGKPVRDHTGKLRTATDWWVIAFGLGHAAAAYELGAAAFKAGRTIRDHTGTPRSAIEWWVIASERGHAVAAYNLGIEANRDGKPVRDHAGTPRTATEWWVLASELGHADATQTLGNLAYQNRILIPDQSGIPHSAIEWWVLASERGHADAALNLADAAYTHGPLAHKASGTIRDHTGTPRSAIEWWVLASERGHADAAYKLGLEAERYRKPVRDHTGTPRSAIEWWVLADERGHPAAANRLGVYANGDGKPIHDHTGTPRTAEEWWITADKRGDPAAVLNLYELAVKSNRSIAGRTAKKWKRRVVKMGFEIE